MIVGILEFEIRIHSSNSLKEKRLVLKSLKDRLKNKFNLSVAELDFQEKWQRSKIGIAVIGNQHSFVENSLHQIFQFIDNADSFEITTYNFDYL
jgi:uncharacterized protein YlxP (DUF503 family)